MQHHVIKFTAGQWFSLCTLVSSFNKTDRLEITESLLKVASNTIIPLLLSLVNNCSLKEMHSYLLTTLRYLYCTIILKILSEIFVFVNCISFSSIDKQYCQYGYFLAVDRSSVAI
jgi:hypothetical protein